MTDAADTAPAVTPKKRPRWRKVLNLGLFALVAVVLVFWGIGAVQGYTGVDGVLHPPRLSPCCDTPADANIAYEDVALTTDDGLTIRGWYLPPSGETDAAIIVAHGAGGNRLALWNIAARLNAAGYGVLMLDLRAHGDSDGDTFTRGWLDILAGSSYLRDRGIEHVGAYGFSLGANMVIQAAALSDGIEAVIADGASPSTLSDMPLPETFMGWLYLPYDVVYWSRLEVLGGQHGGFTLMPMRDAVRQISPRPLLLIASAGDPSSFEVTVGEALFASAGEHATLWVIPNVYHGGGFDADPDNFMERVLGFYHEAFA